MKTMNEYAADYPQFAETPKAVLAAVAYSLAMRVCGDQTDNVRELLMAEWDVLNENGIVPQKRPPRARVGGK